MILCFEVDPLCSSQIQSMSTHTQTKPHPWLKNRHSEKEPTRRGNLVYDGRMINVALDDNRVILTFNIYRSGRTILVMRILPLVVVAIGMTTLAAFISPATRHGNASANKDHKSCHCEYFQSVSFHGVLLLRLKFPWLDGGRGGKVYIGWKVLNIRRLKFREYRGREGIYGLVTVLKQVPASPVPKAETDRVACQKPPHDI